MLEMKAFSWIMLAFACSVMAAGCESKPVPRPFTMSIRMPADPGPDGCPEQGHTAPLDSGYSINTLRITFYRSGAGSHSSETFICDSVLTETDAGRQLYVPSGDDGNLDVVVEGFGPSSTDGPELKALGFSLGEAIGGSEDLTIGLWPVGFFGCTLKRMEMARVFHAAIGLPSGAVLVLGGAGAALDGSSSALVDIPKGLFLLSSAELFDPWSGSFSSPLVTGQPIRRAFHRAFLLDGSTEEQGRILLLGGLTQAQVPESVGAIMLRAGDEPLRFIPHAQARPAPPEIFAYSEGGQVLEWEGTVETGIDIGAVFQESIWLGEAAWSAGGMTLYSPESGISTSETVFGLDPRPDPAFLATVAMQHGRLGHSVSPISADSALIWAGNLTVPDSEVFAAELLQVDPSGYSASLVPLTHGSMVSNMGFPGSTAFHTATVLPSGEVLMTGGFSIQSQNDSVQLIDPDPQDPFAFRVLVDQQQGRYILYSEADPDLPFVQVGHHASSLLEDGSVLVTGGAVSGSASAQVCGDWAPLFCATSQAVEIRPGEAGTEGTSEVLDRGLQEPRFGHAQTLIKGLGVLVTGGIGRRGTELFTLNGAEIFVPSCFADPSRDPMARSPGQVADPGTVCPVSGDI